MMGRIGRIFIAIAVMAPLAAIGFMSVAGHWAFPTLWQAGLTGALWQRLLASDSPLAYSMGLSLAVSVAMAVPATCLGYVVSKQLYFLRGGNKWLQLAYFPYLVAPVVMGVMLRYYFARWGLTGSISGVMLAQAVFVIPYGVLLMATFWNTRIRQLALQAASLGASPWQVDRSVLIPLARPWLALCFVQCFLISWFEYGITQWIGVGKVPTMTILAMHFVKEANPRQAALAACLMVLPVAGLLLANQRLVTKRMKSL